MEIKIPIPFQLNFYPKTLGYYGLSFFLFFVFLSFKVT